MRFSAFVVLFLCLAATGRAQVLDKQVQLERQKFWDNRDWAWYKENIPFFECPDDDITTTWYYRWELLTKHLTYGSPNSGYSFTEFIDRPFWSGAYGAISCPAGHQLYEARWLRSPVVANDYSRYWFRTPGAQPRNYSTWLADSVWAVHQVHPNELLLKDLLPDLVKNYEAWEARHFVPEVGLFWQTGHDDGMEFNINSRQTKDILRGAPGYRPSFNACMWADATAIAEIARLFEQTDIAVTYDRKAADLKKNMQEKLWDARRGFFFPMYRDDEEREGHRIQKLTLTYQTGEFAGNEHGRELIGYVPWQFNMPDRDKGFEQAWKYLMDPDYFAAEYGPTTVERHDPMFLLQKSCCWWSGQSWPYATTQTLKGLANVLQKRGQVSFPAKKRPDPFFWLLQTYARSHRKDGKPYLAEALHPDTGSFEGHDAYNHSEHYFHSGFCDLVITGLVGLQPSNTAELRLVPLAPEEWDYFALDDVMYHGHRLSVVWDRTGTRYKQGRGLHVLADGRLLASTPTLSAMTIALPGGSNESPAENTSANQPVAVNFAVNNDGDYYPRITASFVQPGTSPSKLIDGNYWYHLHPPNRWTAAGSGTEKDSVELDLGIARPVREIRLYFLEDTEAVAVPAEYQLLYEQDGHWLPLPEQTRSPDKPAAHTANTVKFPTTDVRRLKLVVTHSAAGKAGLTEFEVWGEAVRPVKAVRAPEGNLAYRAEGQEFPKASASHTSPYDKVEFANDGRVIFAATPNNRWTSYQSPNASDWVELDFGAPKKVGRVELLIYDDGGGVQAPNAYTVQWLDGVEWTDVANPKTQPETPSGGVANSVRFDSVTTSRLRVVFVHKGTARSGVTEIEAWEK